MAFALLPAAHADPAPAWSVSRWFPAKAAVELADLRGRVVVVEAFQMLCPGCVQHGLPLAGRIRAAFPTDDLVVVGLHTVFEHHEAMTEVALAAFLHEYRLPFPVAVDRPTGRLPETMRAWDLGGTPSLVLIDRAGRMRSRVLGSPGDLAVGAAIAILLAEPAPAR